MSKITIIYPTFLGKSSKIKLDYQKLSLGRAVREYAYQRQNCTPRKHEFIEIPTNNAYKTLLFYFEIGKINGSNSSRSLFEVFIAQRWHYISFNEATM